jgi:hypothetical protein
MVQPSGMRSMLTDFGDSSQGRTALSDFSDPSLGPIGYLRAVAVNSASGGFPPRRSSR